MFMTKRSVSGFGVISIVILAAVIGAAFVGWRVYQNHQATEPQSPPNPGDYTQKQYNDYKNYLNNKAP